jgi:hypothetical protein
LFNIQQVSPLAGTTTSEAPELHSIPTNNNLIAQALPAEILNTNSQVTPLALEVQSSYFAAFNEAKEPVVATPKVKKKIRKLNEWNRFTDYNKNVIAEKRHNKRIKNFFQTFFYKDPRVVNTGQSDTYMIFPRNDVKVRHDEYYRIPKGTWRAGLIFNPEVTRYSDRSNSSLGLHLALSYQYSDFYLTSGVGLRNATEKGNYSIEYNQYLGSYDHVYYVSFDSTEQGVIPTYHTFEVDVYDTINHYKIGETKIHYQYLDIPVLFGYRKSFGKISAFVNAGPNVSFMVGRSVNNPPEMNAKARILKAEQTIPQRVGTNWQLIFGGGIDVELSKRFSFALEPTFRLFMSPEYGSFNSKPYALGVRTGVYYQLGK